MSVRMILLPVSTFNCTNSWKPTFNNMSCLQCKITGLHSSNTHYCFIDPTHIGGHFSVDVKHILLKKNKSWTRVWTEIWKRRKSPWHKCRIHLDWQDRPEHHLLSGLLRCLPEQFDWDFLKLFSLLGSCLSRCLLHKASPRCSWVHFASHLLRTQLDQRSEPRFKIRWCFLLSLVLEISCDHNISMVNFL